jgi:hypothetical protein
MKLVNLTPRQQAELRHIYTGNVAEYAALVPEYEYRSWADSFFNLTAKFVDFFGLSGQPAIPFSKLPMFHWTAKLTIPVTSKGKVKNRSVLQPKAFKVGILPEGTYKDFGCQVLSIRMLNSFWSTFEGMAASDFWQWGLSLDDMQCKNCLAVVADCEDEPSPKTSDRYLPLFCGGCVRDPRLIEVVSVSGQSRPKIHVDGVGLFSYAISTDNYWDTASAAFVELNRHGLLVTPLNYPPAHIETFLDFEHEAWASVHEYPGDKQAQAESSGEYLLVKRDDHKIHSWSAAQADPVIRLALEMEDEWLWQRACPSPFPNLNLYWSPVLDYPWFRDRRTKDWVPAFILKDQNA